VSSASFARCRFISSHTHRLLAPRLGLAHVRPEGSRREGVEHVPQHQPLLLVALEEAPFVVGAGIGEQEDGASLGALAHERAVGGHHELHGGESGSEELA